jgi:UDP-N-acetylmuramoylalanine--D-glutamate ligase
MLSAAGHEAIACGNFGVPLCDAIQGDHANRWYSIEISSFQLETTFLLRTCAAILLNIQADHLDRHGSFENYRAAKYRIAELRAPGAPLVLCVDDPEVAALATRAAKPLLAVSVLTTVDEGGMVQDGELRLRFGGSVERLASVQELPLPGRHNQLNILAAAVACRAAGVPLEAVRRGLLKFRALSHRLQEVAQVRGVRFVDDSKATNVGSALQAIDALSSTKLWVLLGGRDKASDFVPLAAAIEKAGATAITFGEAGRHIADVLTQAGCVSLMRSTTLEAALRTAFQSATSGDIVLLSPACASFDAYTGYAARGDHFAQLARSLSEANA